MRQGLELLLLKFKTFMMLFVILWLEYQSTFTFIIKHKIYLLCLRVIYISVHEGEWLEFFGWNIKKVLIKCMSGPDNLHTNPQVFHYSEMAWFLFSQICLSEEAGDEMHIVAVCDSVGASKPLPIATLRHCMPMVNLLLWLIVWLIESLKKLIIINVQVNILSYVTDQFSWFGAYTTRHI